MSIALHGRLKDLENRVARLEGYVDILRADKQAEPVEVMADADGLVDVGGGVQVEAAELLKAEPGAVIQAVKRKPGRPAKNG